MLITGGNGFGAETSVELIDMDSMDTCEITAFPYGRANHINNENLVCGGSYSSNDFTSRNCISLSAGSWEITHQLTYPRDASSSWDTSEGLYMMGGYSYSSNLRSGLTSELLKPDGSVQESFPLKYSTW